MLNTEQRRKEIKIAVLAFLLSASFYSFMGYGLGFDYFKFYSEQANATTTSYWFNLSPIVIALIAPMVYRWKKSKKVSE